MFDWARPVSPSEGRDQATPAVGSRRLSALVRGVVTDGKHSELKVARNLHLEATILIDQGYNDYKWLTDADGYSSSHA